MCKENSLTTFALLIRKILPRKCWCASSPFQNPGWRTKHYSTAAQLDSSSLHLVTSDGIVMSDWIVRMTLANLQTWTDGLNRPSHPPGSLGSHKRCLLLHNTLHMWYPAKQRIIKPVSGSLTFTRANTFKPEAMMTLGKLPTNVLFFTWPYLMQF